MRIFFTMTAVVTGLTLMAITARADYQAGLRAYRAHDYKSALKEFKSNPTRDSQYNLGVMYFKGEGVKADPLEGVEWFRKAAAKGQVQAQFVLGTIFDGGKNVTQDRAAAAKWYRKAAEQGHPQAQFNLGLMYTNGEGVSKDRAEAVVWLKKAAGNGHQDAGRLLKTMGEKVPPQAMPKTDKNSSKSSAAGTPSELPPGHPR